MSSELPQQLCPQIALVGAGIEGRGDGQLIPRFRLSGGEYPQRIRRLPCPVRDLGPHAAGELRGERVTRVARSALLELFGGGERIARPAESRVDRSQQIEPEHVVHSVVRSEDLIRVRRSRASVPADHRIANRLELPRGCVPEREQGEERAYLSAGFVPSPRTIRFIGKRLTDDAPELPKQRGAWHRVVSAAQVRRRSGVCR